jgi:hypothetical protein
MFSRLRRPKESTLPNDGYPTQLHGRPATAPIVLGLRYRRRGRGAFWRFIAVAVAVAMLTVGIPASLIVDNYFDLESLCYETAVADASYRMGRLKEAEAYLYQEGTVLSNVVKEVRMLPARHDGPFVATVPTVIVLSRSISTRGVSFKQDQPIDIQCRAKFSYRWSATIANARP